jgi:hypothetical protein
MKRISTAFRGLFSDLLFFRVCACLIGIPIVFFAASVALSWHPTDLVEWIGMTVLAAFGFYGGWLLYLSLFGGDDTFVRFAPSLINSNTDTSTNGGSNADGQLFGLLLSLLIILLVGLAALPITVVIRLFRPASSGQ